MVFVLQSIEEGNWWLKMVYLNLLIDRCFKFVLLVEWYESSSGSRQDSHTERQPVARFASHTKRARKICVLECRDTHQTHARTLVKRNRLYGKARNSSPKTSFSFFYFAPFHIYISAALYELIELNTLLDSVFNSILNLSN